MRKITKQITHIILTILLVFTCNLSTVFAQELESLSSSTFDTDNEMLSLDEYNIKFSHEEYNHTEILPRSARLSSVKQKTKNITTSINGMTVGTVTIKYQSYMESGRPKFALNTVSISAPPSRYGIWLLADSYVTYTSDNVAVHYTYTSTVGGMTDYATVNFVPEA